MAKMRGKATIPPPAKDLTMVGKYPAFVKAGGGYIFDDVLEYRVWIHPRGGDDFFQSFGTLEEAKAFAESKREEGKYAVVEDPLALVLQKEYISGKCELVREERIAEWRVEWLFQDTWRTEKNISRAIERCKVDRVEHPEDFK